MGGIFVNSPKAENINFNRHCHAGAKFALLRRLFMPYSKKSSSARFLAPPLQTETAQERKMELGGRRYKAPAFTAGAAGLPVSSSRGTDGRKASVCPSAWWNKGPNPSKQIIRQSMRQSPPCVLPDPHGRGSGRCSGRRQCSCPPELTGCGSGPQPGHPRPLRGHSTY